MQKTAYSLDGIGKVDNVIVVADKIPEGYTLATFETVIGETLEETELRHRQNQHIAVIKKQIDTLELAITNRRMREAASDDAGGNAEGRAWMVNQNSLIDDERTKL
jgi:hypothetical protein